ncbi:hypothetical protein L207DRAFT_172720 [Hyaloscypha variabilis F]|uniref:DUF6594 domain-containing protein n=1 Tax=Hyaloscypha variabilis (strain UAMH 11265 / GT02V1 / F) TaxID=1149755 RepID=A0A2J6R2Z3_HYAVF|nr:hypothetical protein L207DRAFT_172720 [Hyaloscypha variabilis F]
MQKPLDKGEDDWIYHANDFVSLEPATDGQWTENLSRAWDNFWRWHNAHFHPGSPPHLVGWPPSLLRAMAATSCTTLLLIPVILLFAIKFNRTIGLAIILTTVVIFTFMVSLIVKMSPRETYIWIAAYSAVLITLVGKLEYQ